MSSSSDRTKKLSSKVKYNELSSNIRYHGTVTPVKNDGSTYEMFGISKYQNANQSGPIRNSINTFNSYSERMELKKGRFYTNTPINGIDNLKYDIKGGNLMQINYGSNSPLVATGNLELSGGRFMDSVGENLIPYPSNTVDYPGFITDPNNTIFKKVGVGNTENQQQNWVRNLSTTEFNDSNQWNKLNKSQDLHNFSLTGGVNLWTEFTINVTAVTGAYVMNGIHRKGHLTNQQNPTLYFDPYDTINFVIDASGGTSETIHKFRINTTNYKGDDDIYTVSNPPASNPPAPIQGIANGTITWTPSRKGRYFYNCHQHGKMHGIIIIGDGSEKYPVVEQIITDVLAPVITADNTQDLSGNSNTPFYIFTSNEAGTITITPSTYSVTPTSVIVGENTITFNPLSEDTHDISFIVTDSNGNDSLPHVIPRFTIDTTSPVITTNYTNMSGTDITPEFTFTSDKAGTINIIPTTYSVTPTSVIASNNTITFDALPGGTYDLSFSVTDLYNNTTDTKIPQFTITSNVNETAITSSSQVNAIASNGNKYVFNGENSYNPATIYTLTQGSYTFTNIPEAHPMAILNNNNTSNITYSATSNDNNPIIIKVSGGSTTPNSNGDYYTFTNSDSSGINIANGGFKFMRGKTYRFADDGLTTTTTTQSNGYGGTTTTTTITHPLKIITFVNGSTVTNTLNTVDGSITVTIPQNASTTTGELYYQCSNHSDMRGNLSLLYKEVTGSTENGFYDFYYGNMDVTVAGDFGTASVYCYHHGYMGGNNLLKYVS